MLICSIRGRYVDAYVDAIQQQLNNLGLPLLARRPTAREYTELGKMASRDAKGIIDTYNNDLRRHIDILLRDSPNAPLDACRAELRAWQAERMRWKDEQISRASAGNGAEYARGLFVQKNRLTASLVTWHASPPIIANSHKECIARVKQGAVTWETAKGWERTHPNCRHIRQLVGQPVIKGDVWRG
jgi:hypothetical protein